MRLMVDCPRQPETSGVLTPRVPVPPLGVPALPFPGWLVACLRLSDRPCRTYLALPLNFQLLLPQLHCISSLTEPDQQSTPLTMVRPPPPSPRRPAHPLTRPVPHSPSPPPPFTRAGHAPLRPAGRGAGGSGRGGPDEYGRMDPGAWYVGSFYPTSRSCCPWHAEWWA